MVTNKLSKVIGIIKRLNHVYLQNALLSIYHSLFASQLNYGLLLWGTHVYRVSKLHKKSVRIMSNSEYLAHGEPLFKTLKLLKIEDAYKLMKFYYNTHTHYPEILEKIKYKTHTYHGFSYNIKEKYSGRYKYETVF